VRDVGEEKPARVLDPIERVSEVIFGLLMAMTFVGALSVATAGREEVRTMMITALGCNLAWGLADAVMYLVRTVTERTRGRALLARLRGGADAATGQALVAGELPPGLAEHPAPPLRPRLGLDDFKGALGVFLLVVAATFPVVVPFMLFDQAALAVRVSNLVALVILFIAGWILARHAGGSRWQGGTAMAATGAVLMAAIMALGG
jgi:VIT1/CCC1 family predicted Fe2+/Mn2+ transporter